MHTLKHPSKEMDKTQAFTGSACITAWPAGQTMTLHAAPFRAPDKILPIAGKDVSVVQPMKYYNRPLSWRQALFVPVVGILGNE